MKKLTNKTLYLILSILCVFVVSFAIIIICLIFKNPQSEPAETSSFTSSIDTDNSSITESAFLNDSEAGETSQNNVPVVSTEKCNHSYRSEIISPTCEKDGYTVHTCTICGYSYIDSGVAARHDYIDYKCSRCGKIDKTNTYQYLKHWILKKGTTNGTSCALIYNDKNDTYKISYDENNNCIGIYRISNSQTNSYLYTFLTVITIPETTDSYAYVSGLTNITLDSTAYKYTGTIKSATFSDNTPISYSNFVSDIYSSPNNGQLETIRTNILLALTAAGGILHGDFGEYGNSGIDLGDLGFTEFAKNFED